MFLWALLIWSPYLILHEDKQYSRAATISLLNHMCFNFSTSAIMESTRTDRHLVYTCMCAIWGGYYLRKYGHKSHNVRYSSVNKPIGFDDILNVHKVTNLICICICIFVYILWMLESMWNGSFFEICCTWDCYKLGDLHMYNCVWWCHH